MFWLDPWLGGLDFPDLFAICAEPSIFVADATQGLGYPVPSRPDPGRRPESGFVAGPPPGRYARGRLSLMALNAIWLVLREISL
jgi:hypothetical protein